MQISISHDLDIKAAHPFGQESLLIRKAMLYYVYRGMNQ